METLLNGIYKYHFIWKEITETSVEFVSGKAEQFFLSNIKKSFFI